MLQAAFSLIATVGRESTPPSTCQWKDQSADTSAESSSNKHLMTLHSLLSKSLKHIALCLHYCRSKSLSNNVKECTLHCFYRLTSTPVVGAVELRLLAPIQCSEPLPTPAKSPQPCSSQTSQFALGQKPNSKWWSHNPSDRWSHTLSFYYKILKLWSNRRKEQQDFVHEKCEKSMENPTWPTFSSSEIAFPYCFPCNSANPNM